MFKSIFKMCIDVLNRKLKSEKEGMVSPLGLAPYPYGTFPKTKEIHRRKMTVVLEHYPCFTHRSFHSS